MEIKPIAYFRSPFKEKFGIPRQGNVAAKVSGSIVFVPPFDVPDAVRGLEAFSHLWIIWGFSANRKTSKEWSPTVRPPRLGGNERIGVWASRSPYRPNALGLTSVAISKIIDKGGKGIEIEVLGADIMDGTPIYDIKPYVAYADSHADASCGFVDSTPWHGFNIHFPEDFPSMPPDFREQLESVLEEGPVPRYQHDPERIYGLRFGDWNVHFRIDEDELYVLDADEVK